MISLSMRNNLPVATYEATLDRAPLQHERLDRAPAHSENEPTRMETAPHSCLNKMDAKV